jgi:ribonuclease BN (tRNA processing enzyme)
MKVRVLGCSGAIAKGRCTTSFLVDGNLLVDAGTGVGDLTLEEMGRVDHVLLSHSHLDHIAALPLMVDAVAAQRDKPLQVYALPGTVAALRAHVFNNVIWPDFTTIPSAAAPFIQFQPIEIGQVLEIGGKTVEVLPAVHTVPAAGFAIATGGPAWVFTGDTERNPAFWKRFNQLDVGALVIETAFSNSEKKLAQRSLHLSPESLASELGFIGPGKAFPIWVTHTKPAETVLIMSEIHELRHGNTAVLDAALDIRWLKEGQEFEL